VSTGADVGFEVADGSPARLYDAARWHDALADEFDEHAGLIDHTAGSLHPVWRGEAANGYQALSGAVAVHFRAAADGSRSASMTLRRYAHELENYQREGRHCLAEAEHWQQQVLADESKLDRAERAQRAAELAVQQAEHELRAAASAGSAGGVIHPAAAAALGLAQSRLADSQAAVRDALRELQRAKDEFEHWQLRGRQARQEAEHAGAAASRALASLSVSPPPSPAAPVCTPGNQVLGSAGPVAVPVAGAVVSATLGGSNASGPAGAGVPAGAGTTAGGPSLTAVAAGARQGAITFGDLEEIGRRFGWSKGELDAWWQVISDESGGLPTATNPGSGAFGIGQFLGSTYKEYLQFGAGSPNPVDQLNAMAQYIHDRYGSPLAALAHENSCHWY
jgi:hypothetical protein